MSGAVTPAIDSDAFSLRLYEETLQKANQLGYAFLTVSELRAYELDRKIIAEVAAATLPSEQHLSDWTS